MALFTFNFDKRLTGVILTLVIGTVMLGAYNLLIWNIRKQDPGGEAAGKKFWRRKIFPEKKYNIVFLGDSRCVNGMDPSAFEEKLKKSAFNSGFLSGGLSRSLFDHINKKTLSTSSQELRCVVLVVTPVVLSTRGEKNEHFHSLLRSSKKETSEDFSGEDFFRPLNSKEIALLWGDGLSRTVCHDNGWGELHRKVRKRSQRNALRYYETLLAKLEFSKENWENILRQTRLWSDNNVAVFAFYIPSTPALQKMELATPGFDLKKFKSLFEKNGGIFLEIANRESYNAYDAVHLSSADAKRLSKEVAEKMYARLKVSKAVK